MKTSLDDALIGIERIYFDTAPLIYLIEQNPSHFPVVEGIARRVGAGRLVGVTGPVTLSECLVAPVRANDHRLTIQFFRTIVAGRNMVFRTVSAKSSLRTAKFRVKYGLALPDAMQLACALDAGCDAILTNDRDFSPVSEIAVLFVGDLEP